MRAITRVETGRRQDGITQPWPWTVNFAGEGHFFNDPEEAINFVQNLIDQGETVIDVGCLQMNVKWHARRFASLQDMFDPVTNARAAANFIGQLQSETGSWEAAVGYYHSRTPARAQSYADKVVAAFDDLKRAENIDLVDLATQPVTEPVNGRTMVISYPFLQGGQAATPGSLVPASNLAAPLIGG